MEDVDLSKLDRKIIKVPRGYTYTYYTSPASNGRPTIILFHGWPDSANLWANVINNYLLPSDYGIVAVDCLGYGQTSKPTLHTEYAFHLLAADAIAILDAEELPTVISLGHDWGSFIAQRLYNFYPSRVSGLVVINVSYVSPDLPPFELENLLELSRQMFGYGNYEYWKFFATDEGARIMSDNLESVYALAHGSPESWLETMCKPDGARDFVSSGRTQPLLPYAEGRRKAEFMDRMARGRFNAPSCYYKAYCFGTQNESNKLVAEDNAVVKVPTLFWGGTRDMVCRPEILQVSIEAGVLPNLTQKLVDGGHWALLAKPDTFGTDLLSWLEETHGAMGKSSL
ncbi:Bifunctional epoxide hydrolase 2-like protein 2 [Colletotrichum chlorophyti]|uniref:Bifunctional epoxide hydrolase 2-like protein 2 n=1 Tax=Colletotrichum chlorophyti TaxID=708187 RepID=A0A1Q8RMM7_9PEZI|nr:Bifunctional epoxide hydrolase 2-like protein 2 [Colletotrichum chlorophyti]